VRLLPVILLTALCAPSATGQDQPQERIDADPGVRAATAVTDSLVATTAGRYGVMGVETRTRISFVKSEGSFFDCGYSPLLPVACAVCHRWLPVAPLLRGLPDSLISAAWAGDSTATVLLAETLGRDRIERWLASAYLNATHLGPDSTGILPWVTTPWDFAVMLAVMDTFLPGSGVSMPGAPGVDAGLLSAFPEGTDPLACVTLEPYGCRAAFNGRLPDGRTVCISMLADSLESDEAVLERMEILLRSMVEGRIVRTVS
jgi:hypothetical protein